MSTTNGSNGHAGAFDLTGQTAIVTGAATGIGEAIARRLAQAGAIVAIVDIDGPGSERAAADIGHGAFPVQADVADPDAANRAAQEVLARTGNIHVLVINTGIAGAAAPLWEQTFEAWQTNLSVNHLETTNAGTGCLHDR